MILELARGRKFSGEQQCLGTIGLIVAPWKFDVLKTNICPRSEASRANICFKSIKFPRGNYQTDNSETLEYSRCRVVHEIRCFYSLSTVLEESLDVNEIKLKEAHLQFLDFENLKILEKRVHPLTTANLPRTVQFVRLCLWVKFLNEWKNNWKPLFALISVRILLKQLDYLLLISMRR